MGLDGIKGAVSSPSLSFQSHSSGSGIRADLVTAAISLPSPSPSQFLNGFPLFFLHPTFLRNQRILPAFKLWGSAFVHKVDFSKVKGAYFHTQPPVFQVFHPKKKLLQGDRS